MRHTTCLSDGCSPNDGYGAGYGQEETLDGNIRNLKELGDYAREEGVEIGLWTQSDLHPKTRGERPASA